MRHTVTIIHLFFVCLFVFVCFFPIFFCFLSLSLHLSLVYFGTIDITNIKYVKICWLIFTSNSTLLEPSFSVVQQQNMNKAGLLIHSTCFTVTSVMYLNKSSAVMYN